MFVLTVDGALLEFRANAPAYTPMDEEPPERLTAAPCCLYNVEIQFSVFFSSIKNTQRRTNGRGNGGRSVERIQTECASIHAIGRETAGKECSDS